MKVQKIAVTVDAEQWDGSEEAWRRIQALAEGSDNAIGLDYGSRLRIDTLEGTMWAVESDWIIKGVQGELYPCKSEIFDETYVILGGQPS